MKIKPVGKRVVLKMLESMSRTSSGIILGENDREKPDYAEIIAVSEELEKKDLFKIGNKVIYKKYSGTSVKDGEDEFIIIDEEDILGIVE